MNRDSYTLSTGYGLRFTDHDLFMDGILVIDKPRGPTSHDVVQTIRRLTGVRKVGHLGTLDPAASGVLPVAMGRATKRASRLLSSDKTYEFVLKLGMVTETDDDEGRILSEQPVPPALLVRLEELIPQFTGWIMQRPPHFSAVKVGGRRAYELARRGERAELKPRLVRVDLLRIVNVSWPDVRMHMECGGGTYVRSICRDIGEALGCGGHARDIRRLRHGPYTIDAALPLEEIRVRPQICREHLLAF